jgi:DNA-binding transcriptional regulator YiaG
MFRTESVQEQQGLQSIIAHLNEKGIIMATAAVQRLKRKLPERIAQVRGNRSQRQFARDLGVFQQNVNRYENGTTPHTDFLITLALKENVSLDWLLLGKGRPKKK